MSNDHITISRGGPLRQYRASASIERSFFQICGTHVFDVDTRLPEKNGRPAEILFGSQMPNLSGHYFVGDNVKWHEIGDAAMRFGGESGYQPLNVTDQN